ncbi:hypothetical protein FGB62_70g114 [Gracilaria domingensis]|nr:hypothetical protein FGB62_70g114 [Gracilaria domingensis]
MGARRGVEESEDRRSRKMMLKKVRRGRSASNVGAEGGAEWYDKQKLADRSAIRKRDPEKQEPRKDRRAIGKRDLANYVLRNTSAKQDGLDVWICHRRHATAVHQTMLTCVGLTQARAPRTRCCMRYAAAGALHRAAGVHGVNKCCTTDRGGAAPAAGHPYVSLPPTFPAHQRAQYGSIAMGFVVQGRVPTIVWFSAAPLQFFLLSSIHAILVILLAETGTRKSLYLASNWPRNGTRKMGTRFSTPTSIANNFFFLRNSATNIRSSFPRRLPRGLLAFSFLWCLLIGDIAS